VAAEVCPVSYITGQSLAWIEQYAVWKMLRAPVIEELSAKTVEAFCLLESEMAKEASDGQG
jgi:hypothetical protein